MFNSSFCLILYII